MTTPSIISALIAALVATPQAVGPAAGGAAALPVSPDSIEIVLDVRPEEPVIGVEATLRFHVSRDTDAVELFLRPDASLDSVADAEGTALDYRRRRDRLRVSTPPLETGTRAAWTFRYRLHLPGLLREAGQLLSTTPWYPHFRYPADVQEYVRYVPMRSRLTAALPRPWALVAPGVGTTNENGTIVTYTWTESIPSPVVPLVIGYLDDRSRTRSGRLFRVFFPPAHRPVTDIYMDYMVDAVTFFSERIGNLDRRNFSLVALQLPEGMSGLTVAGMTFLEVRDLRAEHPFPYRVLAHELAHHWFNYYIEIPRAADGWLREGLPTYCALLFLENSYGNAMVRQELDRSRRVALSIDSDEPLALGFGMTSADAIYAFNYHKAAFVLHMLREVMGLDRFFALLRDLYEMREDVTTEVFRAEAEKIYGDDLSWFFAAWVDSAAIPSFTVRYRHEVDEDGPIRLYRLRGVIEQRDAAIRHPVLVRVRLDGAPPLEQIVWIEPGTTEFTIALPSLPLGLELDPHGNLLYRELTVEKMDQGPAAPR